MRFSATAAEITDDVQDVIATYRHIYFQSTQMFVMLVKIEM